MKWMRPSGKEIETNDEKLTIEHCVKMNWKNMDVEVKPEVKPVVKPNGKK